MDVVQFYDDTFVDTMKRRREGARQREGEEREGVEIKKEGEANRKEREIIQKREVRTKLTPDHPAACDPVTRIDERCWSTE